MECALHCLEEQRVCPWSQQTHIPALVASGYNYQESTSTLLFSAKNVPESLQGIYSIGNTLGAWHYRCLHQRMPGDTFVGFTNGCQEGTKNNSHLHYVNFKFDMIDVHSMIKFWAPCQPLICTFCILAEFIPWSAHFVLYLTDQDRNVTQSARPLT